jgi:hypothetical protein
MPDIDQHRREGKREDEPKRVRACCCPPLRGESFQDGADGQQIKAERDRLPDEQRKAIGHPRQSGGDEEKVRRIVPAVELRRLAEDGLLARVLLHRIKRRDRVALEHIRARRIDVGEIGPDRPALQVDAACGGHHQIEEARRRGEQDRDSDHPDALAGEPRAAPHRLPHPIHGRCSVFRLSCRAFGLSSLNGALPRAAAFVRMPQN